MTGSLRLNIDPTGTPGSKTVDHGAFFGCRQTELGKNAQLFHLGPRWRNSGGCGELPLGLPMITMRSNF